MSVLGFQHSLSICYSYCVILPNHPMNTSTPAVLVSEQVDSWAVAGDQVLLTITGLDMSKIMYMYMHQYYAWMSTVHSAHVFT